MKAGFGLAYGPKPGIMSVKDLAHGICNGDKGKYRGGRRPGSAKPGPDFACNGKVHWRYCRALSEVVDQERITTLGRKNDRKDWLKQFHVDFWENAKFRSHILHHRLLTISALIKPYIQKKRSTSLEYLFLHLASRNRREARPNLEELHSRERLPNMSFEVE